MVVNSTLHLKHMFVIWSDFPFLALQFVQNCDLMRVEKN